MKTSCKECGTAIDIKHEAHWYCNCNTEKIRWCSFHGGTLGHCPECGDALVYVEASITRRLFEEPGIRGLLGF